MQTYLQYQKTDQWLLGLGDGEEKQEGEITKGTQELEVLDMFILLIAVMVLQVYTYIKTY